MVTLAFITHKTMLSFVIVFNLQGKTCFFTDIALNTQMAIEASLSSHNQEPWITNQLHHPDLLCPSLHLPFHPKVFSLVLEVCFPFLSKLMLGNHKWPQNSIHSSSSSHSSLRVEVPGLPLLGRWSLCVISLFCLSCYSIRTDFWCDGFPSTTSQLGECGWSGEAVMSFLFRREWVAPLPIKASDYLWGLGMGVSSCSY